MSTSTAQHLAALRDEMRRKNVAATIIPGTDPHHSEYVNAHWQFREWLTGFTGSNGTAVVTLDEAGLWTDSRYFLQAQQQLEGSGFALHKEGIPGEATIEEWLASQDLGDGIVGIDGRLFSIIEANRLEAFCGENGLMLAPDFYAADAVWPGRPALPQGEVYVHGLEYAGEDVGSKLQRALDAIDAQGANAMLVTALDDVAWLLNLRGSDIDYTPVFISFAYVSRDERVLFVDEAKLTAEAKGHLKKYGFKVKDYGEINRFLSKRKEDANVLLDPNMVSDALAASLMCGKVYAASPIAELKSVKNDVQIAGTREAMRRDGVALARTLKWVEDGAASGSISEMDVDLHLRQERAASALYRGDSFHTIAGYKEHGAIVHYEAHEDSNVPLGNSGLLLIDAGAQYLDGTTDVTRTITLGNPSPQEIHDYTLVLKGHLALARAKFPVGTRGDQLDALARMPLWQEGMTFMHGTGHGVGHFLCCHEGPQSIRTQHNATPLEPGMITSNEPGVYKAGQYGIRIENLLLCVEGESTSDFGDFLQFETLTLCPYDVRLIDTAMLTSEEVEQINAYHAHVLETLSPLLGDEEKQWLAAKCKAI